MSRAVPGTATALLVLLAAAAAGAAPAPDADALARFRKALDGPAPARERAEAARALGDVDSRAAAELVCRGLGSVLERREDLYRRRTAGREELLRLVGDQEMKESRTFPEETLRRIRRLQADEENLRDDDEQEAEVEGVLRRILPRYRDPKAVDHLASLAGKGGAPGPLRAAVLGALGEIGAGSALKSVRGALRDRDPAVREAALGALARLRAGEEEVLRSLAAALADERWTVRLEAARRIAALASPEGTDLLVARLALEDGRLRGDIADLLRALTGQGFGVEPEGWTHWWRENREAYVGGERVLSVPPEGPTGRRNGAGGEGASYYGITIHSRRILYVIDISGSMARPGSSQPPSPRVEDAKKELLRSIRTLDAGSAFTVYAFHDTVSKWKPGLVKASPEARDDVRKWIEALGASSWTNTYAALEEAIRASAADPRNNMGADYALAADTIFLLTDGAPTTPGGQVRDARGNPEYLRVLAAVRDWNREKRVAIHAIGVGPEVNAEFLSALARENGGEFVHVR